MIVRKWKLGFFSLIVFSSAWAVDDEIRILAVYTSDASTTNIQDQMLNIQQAWISTGLIGFPTPVGVNIANAGLGVALGGAPLTGFDYQQYDQAKIRQELLDKRNQYGADVVVVFTSAMLDDFGRQICGFAKQHDWTDFGGYPGAFVPDLATGLDLRPAETFFLAIVATTPSSCVSGSGEHLSAHEIGHLLGGGHEHGVTTSLPSDGMYLYEDSHAFIKRIYPGRGGGEARGELTALATRHGDGDSMCINSQCDHKLEFSSTNFGDTNHENKRAFEIVAKSVANFRVPPVCGLSPPDEVGGLLTHICYTTQPAQTRYQVWWSNSCSAETDYYELHAGQFIVGPYNKFWTTPNQSSGVYVINPPGPNSNYVKVKACDANGTCSELSDSFAYTPFLCGI